MLSTRIKKSVAITLLVIFLLVSTPVLAESFPSGKLVRSYSSDSLQITVERVLYNQATCFVCRVWMKDPGKQFGKATAEWGKRLMKPAKIVESNTEAIVAINASGFFSSSFKDVPVSYPGKKSDYYETPWGSMALTDGRIDRILPDLNFTGIAITKEGLKMYRNANCEEVLNDQPTDTFAFRNTCCLLENYQDVLERDDFAAARAGRVVVGKVDENNYVLFVVSKISSGLTLMETTEVMMELGCEWAFNLDGGGSNALLFRNTEINEMETVCGGKRAVFDTLYITD